MAVQTVFGLAVKKQEAKDNAIRRLTEVFGVERDLIGFRDKSTARFFYINSDPKEGKVELIEITGWVATALECQRLKDGSVKINCGYCPVLYAATELGRLLGNPGIIGFGCPLKHKTY